MVKVLQVLEDRGQFPCFLSAQNTRDEPIEFFSKRLLAHRVFRISLWVFVKDAIGFPISGLNLSTGGKRLGQCCLHLRVRDHLHLIGLGEYRSVPEPAIVYLFGTHVPVPNGGPDDEGQAILGLPDILRSGIGHIQTLLGGASDRYAGYLIGAYRGLPFRYTWPGYPIGHAVQVQNHGTLQGFAQIPYYFLLGDPRIALQAEPAYRQVGAETSAGTLTISYAGAPVGVIPVRIPGGARFSFVEVSGAGVAWEREPFYNSRLQMADIGDDKFVLFEHKGGDFDLQLRTRPPWYWVPADILMDALDGTLLFLQEGELVHQLALLVRPDQIWKVGVIVKQLVFLFPVLLGRIFPGRFLSLLLSFFTPGQ